MVLQPNSVAAASAREHAGRHAAGGGPWIAPYWLSNLAGVSVALTRENTRVSFRVRWLGGLSVGGEFEGLNGALVVPGHDPSQASVNVQIRADSVCTGLALRDRHLRSRRFLDVPRYPLIAFRGGNVLRGDAAVDVAGSLTIRDVTHTLVLHCRSLTDEPLPAGPVPVNLQSGGRAGRTLRLLVETSFSRQAYGVGASTGFARLDPLMGMIGQKVRVKIEIRL